MNILEIKKFQDPILRKKTKKIKEFNRELEWLILDMKETMIKKEGVGLAAPQIGVSKSIFVYLNTENGKIEELINPKIVKFGKDKVEMEEGCLSFPGIYLKIKRSDHIKVKGYNIEGKEIFIEASGFLSRIIQHETDHLNGILFFDRLPLLDRIKFKIKNGNFKKYSVN